MNNEPKEVYIAPDTRYFKTQEEFDKAVSKDFVKYVNTVTSKKQKFLVCLSHGQSPVGAYRNIVEHYHRIKNTEYIYYTFLNSPLKSQENLEGIFTAAEFLKKLLRKGLITTEQVLGRTVDDNAIEESLEGLNKTITNFFKENKKDSFDYVFVASNPKGRIGGIERKSKAFESKEIYTIVNIGKEKEITTTPYFLLKANRVAFLATKSDKEEP